MSDEKTPVAQAAPAVAAETPTGAPLLEAHDLSCGYRNHTVLEHVNLACGVGEAVCLLGPNGVGKTTLFKTLLGFLAPLAGSVRVDGRDRAHVSRREFSQLVAYVPQLHEPPFPFSALDVVLTGCVAHLGTFATPGRDDYLKASEQLARMGIDHLAERPYTQLSGGEQQMVLVSRALMQDPKMLVMDEPTASLDFGNQVRVLRSVKGLVDAGRGVLMTSHNPDHAFLCCSRAVLVTRDGAVLDGPVDEVVTEENLRRAYGIEVKITEAQDDGGLPVKTCVPMV